MFRIARQNPPSSNTQDKIPFQVIDNKPAQCNDSPEWQFAVPMSLSHLSLFLQYTSKESAAVPRGKNTKPVLHHVHWLACFVSVVFPFSICSLNCQLHAAKLAFSLHLLLSPLAVVVPASTYLVPFVLVHRKISKVASDFLFLFSMALHVHSSETSWWPG